MKIKRYINLSNLSLAASVLLGLFVIISTYSAKASMPAGTCPLQNNDKRIYFAIGLALISVLTDGLGEKNRA